MKEIKSFLMGYFFAWVTMNESISNSSIDYSACTIYTKNGGKLHFSINRGICPEMGHIAFAFYNPQESMFDITSNSTTLSIWNYIIRKIDPEYNEVRVNFDFLCQLIYDFDGFDYEKMKY